MSGHARRTARHDGLSRLFVAAWPDDDALAALDELERPRDQGVRWVPRENLHVTLRFLGDADPDEVSERLDALTADAAHARLGPAVDALAEHSLVIPVTGLDDLAMAVHASLRGVGTANERRRFVGHLTVARLRRSARPRRALGMPFRADFPVTEIALVESTLDPDGARYETLDTWVLRMQPWGIC